MVGDALSRRSMYFEAVPYLLTALETAPSSAWASATLAAVLACHGRVRHAFRFWKLACRLNPMFGEPERCASAENAEWALSLTEAQEHFDDRCSTQVPVQFAAPHSQPDATFWGCAIMRHSLFTVE